MAYGCFTFVFALILLAGPQQAHAYIGPGAGFAVMGSFLAIFAAFFSTLAALLIWPLRLLVRKIRRRRAFAKARIKRFVVLGLDGLDPGLTRAFMAEGKLPHLARLQAQGCFRELVTSTPPISPVAWSCFQTGSNPGKHGIFDFLTRDKQAYLPILSSVQIAAPSRVLNLGPYRLPLQKPVIRLLRKGKSFWKTLGEHGIFSYILRVPISFPPERFNGLQLSAMCVPDLLGTQGSFSHYTTRKQETLPFTGGERIYLQPGSPWIETQLKGPENPFRKDQCPMHLPMRIRIAEEGRAELYLNGERLLLEKNRYSKWINVRFKALPGVKINGVCRFLLLGTAPELDLYVTPIHIDPEKPVMPISYPGILAVYFSKLLGRYATLGLAEDTWALNEKVLSDDGFLNQCIDIENERRAMFLDILDKMTEGVCVCVFDGTDRIQHTFWRYLESDHPANTAAYSRSATSENPIADVYERMDEVVGHAMERCDDGQTVLMVISDHGFTSFHTGVDLNRWLLDNGYLVLKPDADGEKHLRGIDWHQTRAYAIGLAGIFLNLKAREGRGIVSPGAEAKALGAEIAAKLKTLKTADQNPVIRKVHINEVVYSGPYKTEGPDLVIGYEKGYRASWETAVGQVTGSILHPNTKAWSGDHCVDPSLVPGVLFCNYPVADEVPNIMDIGPTALDLFGVKVPGYMDGRPLAVKIRG